MTISKNPTSLNSYSTMTGLASASRPVKLALLTSGAQCAVSGSSIAKGVLGAAVWGFSRSVRLDTWRSRMNAAEIFWSWDWDGLRWLQLYTQEFDCERVWMFTSADVMVQHLRKFLTSSWRWSTCQWISLWESFCRWKPSCIKDWFFWVENSMCACPTPSTQTSSWSSNLYLRGSICWFAEGASHVPKFLLISLATLLWQEIIPERTHITSWSVDDHGQELAGLNSWASDEDKAAEQAEVGRGRVKGLDLW